MYWKLSTTIYSVCKYQIHFWSLRITIRKQIELKAKDAAISADHDAQNIINFDPTFTIPVTPDSKTQRSSSFSNTNPNLSGQGIAAARTKKLNLQSSRYEKINIQMLRSFIII